MAEIILLISGKRKSGKDYICEKLKSKLGEEKCTIIRISEPLKRCYAEKHNLNLTDLMSEGPYKEKYRKDMIEWSDQLRLQCPGYFCEAACKCAKLKPIWIVSDIRRKTDVEWFRKTYNKKVKTVRINADLHVRTQRGWKFTQGVDDVTSECDLDEFNDWDLQMDNNNDDEAQKAIENLLSLVDHENRYL